MIKKIAGIEESQFVLVPEDIISKQFMIDHDYILVKRSTGLETAWMEACSAWMIKKPGKTLWFDELPDKSGSYFVWK